MRPFNFRLDVLLKYRRMQEEQAQINLAQATAVYISEQEKLQVLTDRLFSQADIIRTRQKQAITVATLKMLKDYYDKIKEDIDTQQNVVNLADSRRLECLAVLEEAVKARKLVEKLREKRLLQYQTEMLQEEQKHLDELGLNVFIRRN